MTGLQRRFRQRCATRWAAAVMLTVLLAASFLGAAQVASAQEATPPVTASPVRAPTSTPAPIEALKTGVNSATGAPVVVDGMILFRLQQRVGSISPTERAVLISQRISALISNPFLPSVQLELVDSPGNTDVVADLGPDAKKEILLTVTDADAAATGLDRYELATVWQVALDSAIQAGKQRYGVKSMLFAILETVVACLVLFLVFKGTNRLYARIAKTLDAGPSERSRLAALRNLDLYQSGTLNRGLRSALRWARVLLWILLLGVFVPILFSFFPQTQTLAQHVVAYVQQPLVAVWDGVTSYLPNLVFVAVIIFLLWALTRVVNLVFLEVEKGTLRIGGFDPEWSRLTSRIVNFLVIAGSIVIIYPYLPGSESAAFKGVTVFVGLVLSLSSTSAVANVLAGIIQTYTGAFRVGDVICMNDVTGEVVARTLLVTRVRTWKNEIVSIPNSLALNNDVQNYSGMARQGGLILHTEVTIGYDAPWRQVHQLMLDAARATPGVLPDPPPFVLQTALNDYNVSYQLNAHTDQPTRIPRIYSALHQNIQDCFNQAGVEIMSPTYAALRDGNQVTVPASYLPPTYEAPGFRVAPRGDQHPPSASNEPPPS